MRESIGKLPAVANPPMATELKLQVCVVMLIPASAMLLAVHSFGSPVTWGIFGCLALAIAAVCRAAFRGSPPALAILWCGLLVLFLTLAGASVFSFAALKSFTGLIWLGLAIVVARVMHRVELWSVELDAHDRSKPFCSRCEYDLRGSLEAGRRVCPECGEPIRDDQIKAARASDDQPDAAPPS